MAKNAKLFQVRCNAPAPSVADFSPQGMTNSTARTVSKLAVSGDAVAAGAPGGGPVLSLIYGWLPKIRQPKDGSPGSLETNKAVMFGKLVLLVNSSLCVL